VGNVRALTGKSHTYNIKGSTVAGYEIANGDSIYFRPADCSSIPPANTDGETGLLKVLHYDWVESSSTYKAARVTTPSSLRTLSAVGPEASVRTLVACYATKESLSYGFLAENYVQLADGLEIIEYPRLGPLAAPGNLRALSSSMPAFLVAPFRPGDRLYFKKQWPQGVGKPSDCLLGSPNVHGVLITAIPPSNSRHETTLLSGHAFAEGQAGKITLPELEIDDAYGTPMPTYLSACFIPAGSIEALLEGVNCPLDHPRYTNNLNGGSCTGNLTNAVKLQDDLQVFAEPTDSLALSWFQGRVSELKFTQPQWGVYGTKTFAAGQKGDIIVLQKLSCVNVHKVRAAAYSFGSPHSSRFNLEEYGGETKGDEKGGAAEVAAIAMGKINELSPGLYKICYATMNSEGDDADDFKELSKEIEILPTPATRPVLRVPRTVMLGQEIEIEWESENGLQDTLQSQNSWIGLYMHGSCLPESEAQHECFVAYQPLKDAVHGGSVRFVLDQYKSAGVFDARLFEGDSQNGQGRVCHGLKNSPHETTVRCTLQASVISDAFEVTADQARVEDVDSVPGLEVMFTGNLPRPY